MIQMIVSVGLFLLVLIVMFALRFSDSKTKSVANVKKMVEQIKNDIEKTQESFDEQIKEVEKKISDQSNAVSELIKTSGSQITELKNYSDDFSSLHEAMAKYREALTGLARLTEDADKHLDEIKEDLVQIKQMYDSVGAFKAELQQIETDTRNILSDKAQAYIASLADIISNSEEKVKKALEEKKVPVEASVSIKTERITEEKEDLEENSQDEETSADEEIIYFDENGKN